MMTREELRKLWDEENAKKIVGKKLTQISILKPEDMQKKRVIDERQLDLNMEKQRLMQQLDLNMEKQRLMQRMKAIDGECYYNSQEWWAFVIKTYKIPYGRDYRIEKDGTINLID